ncbi:hypothetical protein CASFOL_016901 [Castilleja foliolosa]|uniref:Uncharacterized protein n=1 Tax=Castilleja foliolosa TaxID=1961234 RepID=A0ABD3DCY7_9LAMI
MAKIVKAIGWGTKDPSGHLSPLEFTRRSTGDLDVQFKVLYSGVCHSDLHQIKNDWGFSQYPMIPGHEIVGVVTETGNWTLTMEFSPMGPSLTAVIPILWWQRRISSSAGRIISRWIGASRWFVQAAGITTYSPLRYYGLDKPGLHVGVAGLGGLGHVAVKFLKAFGAKVTVIDIAPEKKMTLGADQFLLPHELESAKGTLDGILDAVAAFHSIQAYLDLLKPHGKLVMVSLPERPLELPMFALATQRKMIGGSMIGGIKETQEMIDFAAKHNILPDVEIISMDYINTAMERLARGDVKYRFVIDVGKTLKADE